MPYPPPHTSARPLFLVLLRLRSQNPSLRFLCTEPHRSYGPPPPRPIPVDSQLIASSFKRWFKRAPSDLDHLFRILSSVPEGPLLTSALSSLSLSEPFVLRVLGDRSLPLLLKLKFFDWAGRQNHFHHTRSTYHAIFVLLSRARLVSVVLNWISSFSATRHTPTRWTPRFHDTLVIGYAVAGRTTTALQVLGNMRFLGLDLDSFGYHVLLNSLVESGNYADADSLLDQIVDRQLRSPITVHIQIKSLCKQNRLDNARQVLMDAIRDEVVDRVAADRPVASLVNALCQAKRFRDARELAEGFGGSISCSEWLRNLIRFCSAGEAIGFLRSRWESEGYVPEIFNYKMLIYRLLREDRLEEVYDVFVQMRESGIVPDHSTMSASLCFFCKGGMSDVALALYNSREEFGLAPNGLALDHLINALCADGNTDEAVVVLEQGMKQGYFPGKQTFRMLTNLLCNEGKLDKMGKLLDEAMKRRMVPINFACARYITALCSAGRTEDGYSFATEKAAGASIPMSKQSYVGFIYGFIALRRGDMICRVLMEMQDGGFVPSKKLYRDCICCLCKSGNLDLVNSLFQMQLSRQELDQRTCYNYFICGLGHANRPKWAKQVFEMMLANGIQPDLDTKVLMLQSYIKSKQVPDALRFFDEMHMGKEPSKNMYNILIVGLCRASRPDPAETLFWDVRKKGVIPSLQCYEELIKAFCSIRNYRKAVELINDFEKTGRPLSPFICNILLMHSIRTGELKEAFQSKDDKPGRRVEDNGGIKQLLADMVTTFSCGTRLKQPMGNLIENVEKNIPVNLHTYNELLRGLAITRRMDYACNLFERICGKGYTPNKWTYNIIIRGLCDIGKKKDAEAWMEKMHRNGFFPTETTMRFFYMTRES